MNILLEIKKLKRTHLLEIMLAGSFFAGCLPGIQLFLNRPESISNPLIYLFQSNWLLIAMLNVMLSIIMTCVLYQVEYCNHALLHWAALPIPSWKLFLSKCILSFLLLFVVFTIECLLLYICLCTGFQPCSGTLKNLITRMGYAYWLSLPVTAFMLFISSICQNLWTTLGIGVIGIFSSQIINHVDFAAYTPFLLVNQPASSAALDSGFALCALLELILFILPGVYFSYKRRLLQ